MRNRKAIIAALCSAAAALNAAATGFALANDSSEDLTLGLLQLLFALYLLLISVRSVLQDDPTRHTKSIIHVTSLSFPATLLLASVAILPRTAAPSVTSDEENTLHGAWYALTLVYAAICALGVTTPTGPPLHFPPDQIYSEKTAASITNVDLVNVSGEAGMWAFFSRTRSSRSSPECIFQVIRYWEC